MKGLRIVKIVESPKLNKRYKVVLSNGDTFDFGDAGSNTYIDHHNEERRRRYWLRHYGNIREQHLISNLIPSPSLFSALLLWGRSTSLRENIIELNKRFEDKYGSTLMDI